MPHATMYKGSTLKISFECLVGIMKKPDTEGRF